MGHLDDPLNTFWQLFHLSAASGTWRMGTPLGVASNGGLATSVSPSGTVLAGFGLTADIVRTPGDDGYDIVDVTLREADLERVPESRVHTALEASLNCEVRIRTV